MTDLNLPHLKWLAATSNKCGHAWWSESALAKALMTGDEPWDGDYAFMAAFDPPTALALIARIENLEATIQRVRDLHAPDAVFTDTCSECSDYGTDEHPAGRMVEHPCPTIQTLEGDPA